MTPFEFTPSLGTQSLQLKNDVLEEVAKVIKKDQGVSRRTLTNLEKTVVIDALKARYTLNQLLLVLGLSKSSYCYQEALKRSADKYSRLREEIRRILEDEKRCYGYRRIHASLKKLGIFVSEKVVRRIMKQESLLVHQKKCRKYSSYQGEIGTAPENLLKRDFSASSPNEKWLTDITEFRLPAGKVYLSPLIDCFDGLPVSWTIGTSPDAQLVNEMLDAAIEQLGVDEKPVVHTDRGCHYRWPGWVERMDKAGLTRSMSKKGCSLDNAACEDFFGRLKNEMFYYKDWRGVSIRDFMRILDDYLHWYAEHRIKMSLGGMSPLEYRRSLGLTA